MPRPKGAEVVLVEGQPWLMQEGETVPSYTAFKIYCFDLSSATDNPEKRRTLENVSLLLGHTDKSTVLKWSMNHKWVERVAAYENWRAACQMTIYERTAEEFVRSHIAVSSALYAEMGEILKHQANRLLGEARSGVLSGKDLHMYARSLKDWDDMGRRLANLPLNTIPQKAEEQEPEDTVYMIGGIE